jgi:hypothetical protein
VGVVNAPTTALFLAMTYLSVMVSGEVPRQRGRRICAVAITAPPGLSQSVMDHSAMPSLVSVMVTGVLKGRVAPWSMERGRCATREDEQASLLVLQLVDRLVDLLASFFHGSIGIELVLHLLDRLVDLVASPLDRSFAFTPHAY